jgi:adenosylcobyric acid synthase
MRTASIMVQGTRSDVGKSVITAALCRIYCRAGYRVAPFKSQNMALNSYICEDGGEIGRAQAVQAEAAKVKATVDMNPVLLKPNADNNSQVIIRGKPRENMNALYYYSHYDELLNIIKVSLNNLINEFELVVIEGAGSPAEINLRDYDLVNMKVAELADAPVILLADIDRGGVFADIVGTLELLNKEERKRVKGIIINKFRGDIKNFNKGIEFLEDYTKIPILGIVPYFNNIKIAEEDRLSSNIFGSKEYKINIAIIYLPHISNFTDFDSLSLEDETMIKYIRNKEELAEVDLIIIPGSKNTIEDLEYLYTSGIAEEIKKKAGEIPIIGICGGYQIMGRYIKDPLHLESNREKIEGLGLLNTETILKPHKVTAQIEAYLIDDRIFTYSLKNPLSGYEIHQGETRLYSGAFPLFKIKRPGMDEFIYDGAVNINGLVWGTYIHGILDNDRFRRALINYLRRRKGLNELNDNKISLNKLREDSYNKLAEHVKDSLNMELLNDIIFNR